MSDVTNILVAIQRGERHAADDLLAIVYEELRRVAAGKMAREAPGQTLQPTALVHEAWLRLVGNANPQWQNRAHFFGAAAEAMRRILIDNARRKHAVKHGGGQHRVNLEDVDLASVGPDDQLLEVHEALNKLAAIHPVKAEVVKLRYFVGMTNEEVAEVLGISQPTAKRYWAYARAWLYREITGGSQPDGMTDGS